MNTNAAQENGKTPKVIRIVVDFVVDEDLWAEKKAEGYSTNAIVKQVEKSMRIQAPSPCWDYEVQYMKAVFDDETEEENREHDRIVQARMDQIIEETKAEAEVAKLPKDSELRATRAARVQAWRDENREHYNTYMREWQQKKTAEKKAAEEARQTAEAEEVQAQ